MNKVAATFPSIVIRLISVLVLLTLTLAAPALGASTAMTGLGAASLALHEAEQITHEVVIAHVESLMCELDTGTDCDSNVAHQHMGGACCAGHCLDSVLSLTPDDKANPASASFALAVSDPLAPGEWSGQHRPPNS